MSKRDWFEKYRERCKELGIECDVPDVEELYELPKRLQEKIKKDQEEFDRTKPVEEKRNEMFLFRFALGGC